jgi:hypothetical protein
MMTKLLIDRLVLVVLDVLDSAEAWAHSRRDPDAFRVAVRSVLDAALAQLVARFEGDRYTISEVSGPAAKSEQLTVAEKAYRAGWRDAMNHATRIVKGQS